MVTVEPGVYFIPALIARWREQGLHADFINYAAVEQYMDFGGIRLEDDILVTETGTEILSQLPTNYAPAANNRHRYSKFI